MKGQGKGGKTLNDRILAANVRTMALDLIKKYLDGDDEEYRKQLLLRLAGTVLPRINEHSGEGGEPIEHRIIYLPQREQK